MSIGSRRRRHRARLGGGGETRTRARAGRSVFNTTSIAYRLPLTWSALDGHDNNVIDASIVFRNRQFRVGSVKSVTTIILLTNDIE